MIWGLVMLCVFGGLCVAGMAAVLIDARRRDAEEREWMSDG